MHTVVARSAAKLLDRAAEVDLRPGELCGAVGLPPPGPWMAAGRRIRYRRLLHLYEEVALRSGDDAFGLHIAERVRLQDFGALGQAALASPVTLGVALRLVVRHYGLWTNGSCFRLELERREARLSYHVLQPESRQECEASLAIVLTLVRRAGMACGLVGVSFAHARPARLGEHERVFGAPLAFGRATSALLFDRESLELPLGSGSEGSRVSSAVRQVMARLAVEPRQRSLESVARALALSQRTLQRRLAEEGSCFQELLDAASRERCLQRLRAPRLEHRKESLEQLAFQLGFSEPSAFHRAFRRWTGTTPARYQRQMAALDGVLAGR